jgi:outer membrane protein assembly factor BamB
VWKMARQEKTTYSSPVIWKNNVRTELVTTGSTTRSYDPLTGKILWELKMGGEMAIPSPVFDKDHIYVGNAGGREKPGVLYSVKAGAEGDITPKEGETTSKGVEWTSLESGIANPSPLLFEGKLYVLASRGGEIACLDVATGKTLYKQKTEKTGACWASPWAANGKVLFYDEKGITHLVKSGPVFEELGKNQLDDKFWASPAITSDAYVFRGQKKLFCIEKKD